METDTKEFIYYILYICHVIYVSPTKLKLLEGGDKHNKL